MSILKKTVTSATLLGTLAAVVVAADNATFIRRAITYPEREVTDESWYEPLRAVGGHGDRGPPEATSESSGMPRPLGATLSKPAVQGVIDYAREHHSAALVVIHRGHVAVDERFHIDHDTRLNGMSMTKTVIALLVGVAIAEGKIPGLDTPAANYVRAWAEEPDDPRRHITLEHLLTMSSGLRCYNSTSDPFSDLLQMHFSAHVRRVAENVPADHPPGTRYQYNNVNTQILGIVLSEATGTTVADYLSQKIWKPIQASSANMWLDRADGDEKAYCCLFANPRDWARIGQLMLDRGRFGGRQIVPADWIARMLKPSRHEPAYGLHVWLGTPHETRRTKHRSEPFAAPDMFYLDGRAEQRVYVIPSRELVIVRMGERPASWDDALLPNTLVRATGSATAWTGLDEG